ncbi:MAG: trypsin-like peptidase domain-containing protein [Chthoniobacterales bacterium]|nr:trypsin-like peptidase domain-containing protein [Chthoniobacterales bacterium]
MRYQLPRFLLFLFFLFLFVAALFFWKSFSGASVSCQPDSCVTKPHPHSSLLHGGKTIFSLTNPSLEALDQELTNLVAHALPSVVSIIATDQPNHDALLREFFEFTERPIPPSNKMGSGMIVSSKGHIITNWHVIKNTGAIMVELSDGRGISAKLLGFDDRTDIAILKINAEGLTPIVLGDSDQVQVGQSVMAIGNPFGLEETVTEGIISAKGRRAISEAAHEFFQTSALINPGNSGGPLIDIHGEVIGINNFIISRSGGAEGLAFAIPSNVARRVYNDIMQYGYVTRPWFGVILRPLNPRLAHQLCLQSTSGALIVATVPHSPAAQAHLEPGDVITTFNNRPIKDWIDLRNRIAEIKVGTTVSIGIHRAGQPLTIPVTIEEEPE